MFLEGVFSSAVVEILTRSWTTARRSEQWADEAFQYVAARTHPAPNRYSFAAWLDEADTWLAMGSEAAVNGQLPWRGLVRSFEETAASPQEATELARVAAFAFVDYCRTSASPEVAAAVSSLSTLLDFSARLDRLGVGGVGERYTVDALRGDLANLGDAPDDAGWIAGYLSGLGRELVAAIEAANNSRIGTLTRLIDYRRRLLVWAERRIDATWDIPISLSDLNAALRSSWPGAQASGWFLPTLRRRNEGPRDSSELDGTNLVEAGPGQGKSTLLAVHAIRFTTDPEFLAESGLVIVARASQLLGHTDAVEDLAQASEVPIEPDLLAESWNSEMPIHILLDGLDEARVSVAALNELVSSIRTRKKAVLVATTRPDVGGSRLRVDRQLTLHWEPMHLLHLARAVSTVLTGRPVPQGFDEVARNLATSPLLATITALLVADPQTNVRAEHRSLVMAAASRLLWREADKVKQHHRLTPLALERELASAEALCGHLALRHFFDGTGVNWGAALRPSDEPSVSHIAQAIATALFVPFRTGNSLELSWRPVHLEFATELAARELAAIEAVELGRRIAAAPGLLPQDLLVRTLQTSDTPDIIFRAASGRAYVCSQPFALDLGLADALVRETGAADWPESMRSEIEIRFAAYLYVEAYRRQSLYHDDVEAVDSAGPGWRLDAARRAIVDHCLGRELYPPFEKWQLDADRLANMLIEEDIFEFVAAGIPSGHSDWTVSLSVLRTWCSKSSAATGLAAETLADVLAREDRGQIGWLASQLAVLATGALASEETVLRVSSLLASELVALSWYLEEIFGTSTRLCAHLAETLLAEVGKFIGRFDPESDRIVAAHWLAAACATQPFSVERVLADLPTGSRTVDFLIAALDSMWIPFCDSPLEVLPSDVQGRFEKLVIGEVLRRDPTPGQLRELHDDHRSLPVDVLRALVDRGADWAIEVLHSNSNANAEDRRLTGRLLAERVLRDQDIPFVVRRHPEPVVQALRDMELDEPAIESLLDPTDFGAYPFYRKLVDAKLLAPLSLISMLEPVVSTVNLHSLRMNEDEWPELQPLIARRFLECWADEQVYDAAIESVLRDRPSLADEVPLGRRLCDPVARSVLRGELDLLEGLRVQERLRRIGRSFEPIFLGGGGDRIGLFNRPSSADVDEVVSVLGASAFVEALCLMGGVDQPPSLEDFKSVDAELDHKLLVWLLCLARASEGATRTKYADILESVVRRPGGAHLIIRGLYPSIDPAFIGISSNLDRLCFRIEGLRRAIVRGRERSRARSKQMQVVGRRSGEFGPVPAFELLSIERLRSDVAARYDRDGFLAEGAKIAAEYRSAIPGRVLKNLDLELREVRVRTGDVSSSSVESVSSRSRVFLSYVREDSATVEMVKKSLEDAGFDVWHDREDLLPGQRWRNEIRAAIENGSGFVACFSASYLERSVSYMNEELTQAIDAIRARPSDRSWFIPLRLDDCVVPARSIGGGETLRDIQSVDWFADPARAIALISRALGGSRRS